MTRIAPAANVNEIRRLAEEAKVAAAETVGVDVAVVIAALADALVLAAELLDHQQSFLIDLRNHKADAS